MDEKKKCSHCGLLIDSSLDTCPYCGNKQSEITEEKKKENKIFSIKDKKSNKIDYLEGSRVLVFSYKKHIAFIINGLVMLSIVNAIITYILIGIYGKDYVSNSINALAIISFLSYAVLFLLNLLILNKDIGRFTKIVLKEYKNYFIGVMFGILLICTSILYSTVITNLGFGENSNQDSATSIMLAYPKTSILILGIIGPLCEEFCYRVGLFGMLRRHNRIAAYIVTSLIFGFIHFSFDFSNTAVLVNELINLPSYIIAGLILCYAYDKYGFGASMCAHMFNNLIICIISLIP